MPEARFKDVEERIKNGGILMGVHQCDDADAAHLDDQRKVNKGQNVCR